MTELVPPSFLVRLSCGVEYRENLRLASVDRLLDLPQRCRLVIPCQLDHAQSNVQVRAGWNDQGLGLAVEAPKSTQTILLSPFDFWIDTRCTQNVHRASKYCLSFRCRATSRKTSTMSVAQQTINRARENAPDVPVKEIQTRCHWGTFASHDEIEVWLPREVLPGFDPQSSNRLGFFCAVGEGAENRTYLATNSDFPFQEDPSVWHALELQPRA